MAVNKQFRGINIKGEPMNSDSWQNAYLFISQERHTFMIINTVVRDLLWNGKAENTWSRVKTMRHLVKGLGFTTRENSSCVSTRLPRGARLDDKWAMTFSVTQTLYILFQKTFKGGGRPLRGGESFIRLKKPSLHLSLLKLVVKSVKTHLGSSWMISDGLTDSCIVLVLKCRFGVIQRDVIISGLRRHFV